MTDYLAAQTTPLCFMPDGKLVCYQQGSILLISNGKEQKRYPVFRGTKERLCGKSRLLIRLLRLGIRAAVAIDNSLVVLSIDGLLYEFDVNTGRLSQGYFCGEGIRPLVLSSVSNIAGFEDGVYFGGYLHNFDKKPVSIYYRTGLDVWDVIYKFPEGAINHVHNVIPDPYRQCLWIFTGDFGESAAIWKVTDGFKRVERFVSGDQKWRGCVAFAIPEGILYATDAPFTQNHIYLLKDDRTASVIADLPGSCIYGCQWNDKYVFSTAVEPDGRNETKLRLLFGWKRGLGIEDNFAHIFCGNIKEGFIEIYKEKKDLYPFLFQFGAFRFPTGWNKSESLIFQPIATRDNDIQLVDYKL